MKNTVFTGAGTAIITPFTENGVDWETFGRLIDYQLAEGINAIVAAGTTGEGSTLTAKEHEEVISFTVRRVNGKIPVIAGAGSNDTAKAIEATKTACAAGADASSKPCILYNVPSRTGLNMLPETLSVLADHPRIAAVKEACGNISQVAKDILLCGDRIDIYSGCDDQIVPTLSLGGKGVISVIANIMPAETAEICARFFKGDIEGAAALQLKMLSLMNQLMLETNPIPAKAACAAMGFGENSLRLPLVPMEEGNRQKLLQLMKEQGLTITEVRE